MICVFGKRCNSEEVSSRFCQGDSVHVSSTVYTTPAIHYFFSKLRIHTQTGRSSTLIAWKKHDGGLRCQPNNGVTVGSFGQRADGVVEEGSS